MRRSTLVIMLALAGSNISPPTALPQCSSYCEVGAVGTGGLSSEGKAQGFHYVVPGHMVGSTATNSGNLEAGRLVIDRFGNVVGTLSGTYRDGICRGLETGIFGDSEGLDPYCDE